MQLGRLRGRSEPMAGALSVVGAAQQPGSGGVVLVTEPSGVGKTALTAEVCCQAERMKLRVAVGSCDRIGRVSPGAPLLAMLRAGRDPLISSSGKQAIVRAGGEPLPF